MKKVRIGGGQGFWGDSNDAACHMVRHGELDYMACDYLAELTLSIMARQRMKNPKTGYARDFLDIFREVGEEAYRNGTKMITNAGGMNIRGCVDGIVGLAEEKKMSGFKVGYVLGDDMSGQIDQMLAAGIRFENMDGEGDFNEIRDKIVNANVYFGHEPIEACLQQGANVVITGRSSDSAMFLAPLKHAMGWQESDWDRLARGIIAGHLLECGGQGSGGNFDYGWRDVPDMDNLGFPIAELEGDNMVITKAPDCGGLICEQSCKEQLLYEIHDPAAYITPDVVADVSKACLRQSGDNRVAVQGVTGRARPDTLKLSIGYHAGYRTVGMLSFAWPDAYEKAQYAAEILIKKLKRKGLKAREIRVDYIGLNALHLAVADMSPERLKDVNEVIMRIAVRSDDEAEAAKLIPEVAPLQLNGPPGASFFGGRPKVQEIIGLWPTLIPRSSVALTSHVITIK